MSNKYSQLFLAAVLAVGSSLSILSNANATSSYATFGDEIVYLAEKQLGLPYVWGGESPSKGFDCSGLVKFAFQEFNVKLPHRADLQFKYGTNIPREQLKAGDLLFFKSTRGSWIGHVGIYIGNDKFIHAPRRGKPVKIDKLSNRWYTRHYMGARRLKPEYF